VTIDWRLGMASYTGTWLEKTQGIDLKPITLEELMIFAIQAGHIPKEYLDRWYTEYLLWKESEACNRKEVS